MIRLGQINLPLYVAPYTIPAQMGDPDNLIFDSYSLQPNITYSNAGLNNLMCCKPFDYGLNLSMSVPQNSLGGNANTGYSVISNNAYSMSIHNTQDAFAPYIPAFYQIFKTPVISAGGMEGFVNNSPPAFAGANESTGWACNTPYLNAMFVESFTNVFKIPKYFISKSFKQATVCCIMAPGTGSAPSLFNICSENGVDITQFNTQAITGNIYSYVAYNSTTFNRPIGNNYWINQGCVLLQGGGASGLFYMTFDQFLPFEINGTPTPTQGPTYTSNQTQLTISDNPTLNAALLNDVVVTGVSDNFFIIRVDGYTKFSQMHSYFGLIFPDKGYYIDVNLVPKSAQATSYLTQATQSMVYDPNGWFMAKTQQFGQSSALYHTVALNVDLNFPPIPKNAINPLPCFNNAIEGLIVG